MSHLLFASFMIWRVHTVVYENSVIMLMGFETECVSLSANAQVCDVKYTRLGLQTLLHTFFSNAL